MKLGTTVHLKIPFFIKRVKMTLSCKVNLWVNRVHTSSFQSTKVRACWLGSDSGTVHSFHQRSVGPRGYSYPRPLASPCIVGPDFILLCRARRDVLAMPKLLFLWRRICRRMSRMSTQNRGIFALRAPRACRLQVGWRCDVTFGRTYVSCWHVQNRGTANR